MEVKIERILCSIDLSEYSEQVIACGLALAKAFDARLHVCHVIDISSAALFSECGDPVELERRISRQASDYVKKNTDKDSAEWELIVEKGRPALEIARVAEKKKTDLVIAATHKRSGVKWLILGSVVENLMRISPCPLLILNIPEGRVLLSGRHAAGFERILVGCDFSPYSRLAFRYGLSLAKRFGSELHLVHAVEPPAYKELVRPANGSEEKILALVRAQFGERLREMVPEEAYRCCSLKTSVLAGEPHEEIIAYAGGQDIDLIVLGVRGRSLVEKFFLGSTTDRVIRKAPCPVLSVRPTIDSI